MSRSGNCTVIFAVIFIAYAVALLAPAADAASEGGHNLGWIAGGAAAECKGSMAECLAAGEFGVDEFEMDSEINRRVLQANRRYISYGALSRNSVPCSRRGASYYNCRAGAQANPYSRGCSAITRCRS